MTINKICFDSFKVKTLSDGQDVMIEGFANKAVIDRGNDLIDPKAWKLDNYKKNPILLFAHDPQKPIGRAIEVKATEDGLVIKARLSRSKDPSVSLVRDLIKEGILNSFSVGFDAKRSEKSADGANVIKDAELMEVSVVSIPMNQDSTFSVTAKDLQSLTLKEARVKVLQAKGADDSAKLAEMLFSTGDDDATIQRVAKAAGCNEMQVKDAVTSGTVSDEIKKAALEVMAPAEAVPNDQPGMGEVCVQAIMIPKAKAATPEEAANLAEAGGWEAADIIEAGEFWQLTQEAKELFVSPEFSKHDLGEGVVAMVGVLKPENSEAAEAPVVEAQPAEKAALPPEGPTVPLTAQPDPSIQDNNPHLDLAKQTNVLLAQVVGELQILSKKLDGMAALPAPMKEQIAQEQADKQDPNLVKALKEIAVIQGETMQKLKKLGA